MLRTDGQTRGMSAPREGFTFVCFIFYRIITDVILIYLNDNKIFFKSFIIAVIAVN